MMAMRSEGTPDFWAFSSISSSSRICRAIGFPKMSAASSARSARSSASEPVNAGVGPSMVSWLARSAASAAAGSSWVVHDTLPDRYEVTVGGAVESSEQAQGPILSIMPLMLFIMATLLMIQLKSFQRMFLVFAVAPLGIIGVAAALLLSGSAMGFVAILGILALIGILIRNSVILVVQIEHLRSSGMDAWDAVVEATEHRMRPIMLTAAAASLALIPIAGEIFWGPMAFAMMGGIIVGTALTLLFIPALYVAWFRIKAPKRKDIGVSDPVPV